MLQIVLAAGIWAYNIAKIAQLSSRNNRIQRRDSEEDTEKNLNLYNNCTFKYEDKRTYNHYENCTFNYYIIKRGNDDE